jgi:hypothetical protein
MTKAAWSLRLKLVALAVVCIALGFIAGWLTRWWNEPSISAHLSAPAFQVAAPTSAEAPTPIANSGNSQLSAHYEAPAPGTYDPAAVPNSVTVGNYQLEYHIENAVLPDPKLTPGDVFREATAEDVCTPGWSRDHRHVTESEKTKVYEEYPDSGRKCVCINGLPGCCDVDHLIPLEIGGSNDTKNLWPEPEEPRPGSFEKDQIENRLHALVCEGKMSLVDAQKCIASNWIACWQKHVVEPDAVRSSN